MSNKFVFSIIIAIYNTEKYLSEAVESIINQSFDFNKVQLVLVDDGSTDSSGEICRNYQKRYPDNIIYLYKENGGQGTARNLGLNYAEGTFINFLDSDDKFELNALEEVHNLFEKHGEEIDVVSTPRYYFEAKEGPLSLNYRFSETRVIDILKEYNCPQLSISCVFIRRSSFEGKFNSRLIISEDAAVITPIILKKCKYGVVNTTKYWYRHRLDEDSTINTKKLDKSYFIPRLYYYFKYLINYSIKEFGHVPKYVQFALMFDLQWLYEDNYNREILDDVEQLEFEALLYDILQYIDDDIILEQKYLDKYLKYHILEFKHDPSRFCNIHTSDNVTLNYGNITIDELKNNEVKILNFFIKDNTLHLSCVFNSCFKNANILVYENDELANIDLFEGSQDFALGNQVSNKIYFDVKMPLTSQQDSISFNVEIDSKAYPVRLNDSKNRFDLNIENNTLKIENEVIL